MNENFYNIPTTPPPSSSPTNAVNAQSAAQQVATQSVFDISGLLSAINAFLLAWTIFYSIVLVVDFFFYRIKYNEGQVNREKRGVLSLTNAYHLWLSYVGYLVLFMLYLGFKNELFAILIGVIAVLYSLVKIIIIDTQKIPVISKYSKDIAKYALMPFTLLADNVSKIVIPPKPPAVPDKKPPAAPAGDKKK
jgi:amino acid transporter